MKTGGGQFHLLWSWIAVGERNHPSGLNYCHDKASWAAAIEAGNVANSQLGLPNVNEIGRRAHLFDILRPKAATLHFHSRILTCILIAQPTHDLGGDKHGFESR